MGYGFRVNSTALIHASFVLVPLALTLIISLFIFTKKGPHPETYDMSERWTHDPILWASKEPDDHGHGGHDSAFDCGRWRKWQVVRLQPSGRVGLAELPVGYVVTSSGRVSGVTEPGDLSVHYPFPNMELVVLDNALKYGSRAAHARFAVYIGDLGADTAATARELLAKVPTPDNAVLLAVSPNQKAIEVVYGRR